MYSSTLKLPLLHAHTQARTHMHTKMNSLVTLHNSSEVTHGDSPDPFPHPIYGKKWPDHSSVYGSVLVLAISK